MSAEPSAFEQMMVELINRARSDPQGEFDKLILSTDPVVGAEPSITSALRFFGVDIDLFAAQLATAQASAPLAWSEELGVSSTTHSQLMIDFDTQSHNLPGEASLRDRFVDAGYTSFSRIGESIFAFTRSPLQGHAAFYIDWGNGPGGIQSPAGHRDAMLSSAFTEIGVGVIEVSDPGADVGPFVVTQHFGDRFGEGPKLTGVAIDDLDGDDFYDIGEGLGGVTVTAVGTNGTYSTVTYDAGGYTLDLPSGEYEVTFSGGDLGGSAVKSVTIGGENVKLDVESDDVVVPNLLVQGDDDDNLLNGGPGANYIQGRGGDDTLNGGENDDLLEPGAGADTVDGGAGQDLLSALDAAGPVTIDLGNVALSSAGYADKTLISIEGVLGVAGFGNTLVGGGGEDLLIGGDVADSIAGAGGADILLGLGGADTISGGAGDDLILGLEGDDVLTGDAGRDLFLFEPGDGADVVTDFELPVGGSGFEDRLFFSGLGLTFADLDIAEVGGDVVIGYGTNPAAFDGSVTVEGVTLADLVPGGAQPDWIFVF